MPKPVPDSHPESELAARSDHSPVTKQDLKEMEARLMLAIRTADQISFLDQHALNATLSRSRRLAMRLRALDAQTPPQS